MSYQPKVYKDKGGDRLVVAAGGELEVYGANIAPLQTGNSFYVDSGSGSDTNDGLSSSTPLATIDAAIGKCTANNDDKIYVMAGHAETITAAGGITADIAGVEIIGLGVGNDKPKITFGSAVTASMVISAASVKISGIICIAGIDSLTNPIHVQAADVDLDIEWRDGSSTVEAVRAILTTAAADRLNVNLKYIGFPAGNACVNAIRLVGGNDVRISIDFYGLASTSVVEFHTTACSNVTVDGFVYNSGTSDYTKTVVDTVTGSTWSLKYFDGEAGNMASGSQDAAPASDDVSGVSTQVTNLQADVGDVSARTNLQSLLAILGNPDTAGATIWSALINTNASFNSKLGTKVTKAAADILDGTQQEMFTVAGGRVLITHIELEVTTAAVDAGANNTQIVTNPTVGTDAPLCAVLDVDGDESGTIYTVTGEPATAMQGGSGGGAPGMVTSGFVVPEGTIDLLSAADGGTGGALIKAEVWYIPLDSGATVVEYST